MRYALLGPACAFVLGAAMGHGAGLGLAVSAVAAAVLLCLGLLSHLKRLRAATLLCLSLAAGVTGAGYATARKPSTPLRAPFPVNEVSSFEGCVCGPTTGVPGALRLIAEVGEGRRMTLSHGSDSRRFAYGERIRFRAAPRVPRNFENPGSFNYREWLAARGVFWQARLEPKTRIELLPGMCGNGFGRLVHRMRASALDRIDALYAGDDYRKAMMKGLLLGESSEIKRAWVEGFRQTGTYHALVISGSHVAFVAGVFMIYLRRFRYGTAAVLFLACAVAWTYALMAGGDPPVTRTAAGFTLAAVARLHFRRVSLLHVLAVVAVVFLALEPWQVADAGFQLSFLAVAAIGAIATPWTDDYLAPAAQAAAACRHPRAGHLRVRASEVWFVEIRLICDTIALKTGWPADRIRRWAGRILGPALSLLGLFTVSAAIQLALALPMVLYFHRISISGLSANVLATPVITMAIPAGFLGVLTGWQWAAGLAAILLDIGARIVAWHGALEPAWRIPDPPVWLIFAFAASSAALGVAVVARRLRTAAFAVNLALLAAVAAHPFAPDIKPGSFELAAIDVGQAESLFAALPGGQSILVDTGGFAGPASQQRSRLDPGEDVVSPYLWRRGVKRLDAVIISHFHSDHCGGLPAVLRNFLPNELWTGGIPREMAADVRRWTAETGTRIRILERGQRLSMGGVAFEVLGPASTARDRSASNNDSLIVRATYGRHAFLLTGDIERSVEREVMESGAPLRAQILKVPHHGSARSNLPEFLDTVAPAVALISAAGNDWMRLPNEKVVRSLYDRHALVLRTDRDGLVFVRSDGRYLEPGSLRWMSPGVALIDPF